LGGTLSGVVVEDNNGARLAQQPDFQPTVVHWSPPLGEIIRSINKYSNNVMTRLLMLTLGHQWDESATTLFAGQQAIYDFLTERQIPHTSLVLDNGSGLSRETRISADDLGAALNFAWHSPYMPEFLASLPLSGMDGTMSTRLTDSSARGRMHVKTGSLDDVAGVAGYVYSQSGDQYLVIVMLNHEAADQGLGQELSDVVLAWTVRQ
jgi:D-alanyl-D-alanine carboxypeptidase/D-alanyl-D-alanine-endopeptidase (penicillin-binding protein 4)